MYQVIDAAGRTLTLEDDEPCPPGCTLRTSLQFMDSVQRSVCDARDWRVDAPPAGAYFTRDCHGRPNGIADIAGELKRVSAAYDYGQRLANAHRKPVRDGKPNPWRFYRDWQIAHGNL